MTPDVAQVVEQMIPPNQNLKSTEHLNYQPGDLVRIQCQESTALPVQKVWDGCWGIVQSTNNAHVRVLVGNKEVDYTASDLNRDNVLDVHRETCDRILALWQTELEAIEQTVLQELQRRQFFTDLETQIICFMEAKLHRASQAPFGHRRGSSQ